MSKIKYVALLAIAVLFVSVIAVFGYSIGGDMPDPVDDERYPVSQTNVPPVIDGNVQVGVTWPIGSSMGHTYIAQQSGGIPTTDVYMLFDNLVGYEEVDNPPAGYGPEDEVERIPGIPYYLYIGVKAIDGYTIADDGNWLVIDWDQDDVIDFVDHNGNSAGKGKKQGYSTQYAWTPEGVEWAIPYIDEFNGICESPLSIMIHIEIIKPSGGTETTTFPDRPPGHFLSIEICPGDLVGPEPPPEPGEWGIRTIGFWKHQLRCGLGICKGHQHVSTNDMVYYLGEISSQSDIYELQEMDSSMYDALALLELRGQHPMYDRAVQQLLGTWLNYVSGNEQWDSDGDGDIDADDEYLIDVIEWAEDLLNDGDPTNDEMVKDYLDTLNNSGDE